MSYGRSKAQLERAAQLIPLGAQTFSKTRIHFPGAAPRFLSHGLGGLCYDIDGNEYCDLVGGLGANVLGYRDPDVDGAIRDQLNNGISFSLATEIELDLVQRLRRLYPCAEMVRFGKSGTDATTAAVRLARAFTGRHYIAFTGYHGWGDWSIHSTNPVGVPDHFYARKVPFGNIQALGTMMEHFHPAAVVIDPSMAMPPGADRGIDQYFEDARELCDAHETLLVFDEVLTAFRFDKGGAQTLFGVTPDLACLGKAMGNGMPISAVLGRGDVLSQINQPGVFYSGTYFGETLSIAAAIACIDKIEREDVCRHLWDIGAQFAEAFDTEIAKFDLKDQINLAGAAPYLRIEFANPHMKSLFSETMCASGTLISATIVPCFAHDQNAVDRVKKSVTHTMAVLADAHRLLGGAADGTQNHPAAGLSGHHNHPLPTEPAVQRSAAG